MPWSAVTRNDFFYNLVVFVLLKFLISGLGSSMDFCQGRNSLAICDFEDFPVVKDFLCENCAVTAQWTNFKPLSSATPGEMQDGKYEKLAQWLSASARLNNLSYLALYSNKGETLVSLCYAFQRCAQIYQIWPNMHFWHIFGRAKYGQVGCPWKDVTKCSSDALSIVLCQ